MIEKEILKILWKTILEKYRAKEEDPELDCGCCCNGKWLSLEAIKEIIVEVDESYYD
mgnify:CR=1 FL=1